MKDAGEGRDMARVLQSRRLHLVLDADTALDGGGWSPRCG